MALLSTWDAGEVLLKYQCKYAACPFCYHSKCIGDKEIAIKYNFCSKHKNETL
jgi:hypothetical protein